MKTNELRIGNLVAVTQQVYSALSEEPPLLNCMFTVNSISKDEIEIYNSEENVWHHAIIEELVPIELNEELFIECGLLKTKENSFLLGCYEIFQQGDEYIIFLNGIVARIKYLHQLQNFYFVLTNEELLK